MYKVKDIARKIEELAPLSLAEPWDNVGLMVGDMNADISRVFVCLDVTSENAAAAIDCGANLIVSHHPLLFSPLKRISENDVIGSTVMSLIRNDISVYSAHTNFDNAIGGMNDILAEKLELIDVRVYTDEECHDALGNPTCKIGRVGRLESPLELGDYVSFVKSVLGCRTIRYVGDPTETISNVALCSGAGGDGIYSAYHAGADVYVTSDIKHHEAQLAFELGINMIDAGHFETENIICEFMHNYLGESFPSVSIISSDSEPYFKI